MLPGFLWSLINALSLLCLLNQLCLCTLPPYYFEPRLPHTLVGCDEVDCPLESADNRTANCTLVDKRYTTIGLSRIPFDSGSLLYGLSWVEGVATEDHKDGRTFMKNFYLGTPLALNLSGLTGCAIFFAAENRIPAGREPWGSPDGSSVSICPDAMSTACVDALNTQARNVDVQNLTTEEACSRVRQDLEDNFEPACASSAPDQKWTNLIAVALTGPKASSPISSDQNATSNCWPVIPQSDSLTLVETIEVEGNFKEADIMWNFFQFVPILTVIFPGASSLINQSESQMNCMKTVNRNNGTPPGFNFSPPKLNPNSSPALHPSRCLIYMTIIVSAVVLMVL